MNEFEQKLNSILSDPQEMEKISRLAAQIMGGSGDAGEFRPPADGGLPDLKGLLNSLGQSGDKAALVRALCPFLHPERQAKLQKALRLAEAARLAGVALDAYGG